jgi:hypothetical protein
MFNSLIFLTKDDTKILNTFAFCWFKFLNFIIISKSTDMFNQSLSETPYLVFKYLKFKSEDLNLWVSYFNCLGMRVSQSYINENPRLLIQSLIKEVDLELRLYNINLHQVKLSKLEQINTFPEYEKLPPSDLPWNRPIGFFDYNQAEDVDEYQDFIDESYMCFKDDEYINDLINSELDSDVDNIPLIFDTINDSRCSSLMTSLTNEIAGICLAYTPNVNENIRFGDIFFKTIRPTISDKIGLGQCFWPTYCNAKIIEKNNFFRECLNKKEKELLTTLINLFDDTTMKIDTLESIQKLKPLEIKDLALESELIKVKEVRKSMTTDTFSIMSGTNIKRIADIVNLEAQKILASTTEKGLWEKFTNIDIFDPGGKIKKYKILKDQKIRAELNIINADFADMLIAGTATISQSFSTSISSILNFAIMHDVNNKMIPKILVI